MKDSIKYEQIFNYLLSDMSEFRNLGIEFIKKANSEEQAELVKRYLELRNEFIFLKEVSNLFWSLNWNNNKT